MIIQTVVLIEELIKFYQNNGKEPIEASLIIADNPLLGNYATSCLVNFNTNDYDCEFHSTNPSVKIKKKENSFHTRSMEIFEEHKKSHGITEHSNPKSH